MDTCKNCGMPLDDPDAELCSACRAQKSALLPKNRSGRASHTRRVRMNRTTRSMLVIVCVLSVILAALCITATVLYNRYNPEKFLAAFDTALAENDAGALKPMLTGANLSVSDEGAAALCRAFADETSRNKLCAQLEAQIIDETYAGDFPALAVKKDPVFFGYCRYAVAVHSVSLMLNAPAQNLVLSINGIPQNGTHTETGILYENLFPGSYTVSVTGTTAAGQNVAGSEVTLALFDSDEPALFAGALPIGAVTVSGCPSDDAVITLDGTELADKPSDGVVTLPQIALGSKIGMSYTSPWGSVTTASVEFTDIEKTELTFEDFATEGGTPAADTLNSLLTAHLATYLDALTHQDTALISGCTADYKNHLAEGLSSEEHKEHIYNMKSAECKPDAIKLTEADGGAHISCYAHVEYSTLNRESNKESDHSEYRVIVLTWEDGWKVSGSAESTEEAFNSGAMDVLP